LEIIVQSMFDICDVIGIILMVG